MKQNRVLRFLCAVLCALAILLPSAPSAQAAGDVYFTAINDSLLELLNRPMPLWSGGVLYVPYDVFDGNNTSGVDLGITSSYNREAGILALFGNLQQALAFDFNRGICYDAITDTQLSGKPILRNGTPYVPVSTVCSFFGLTYSTISISQGYVVRIKNDGAVLSDGMFVDAASGLIERRYREYTQANQLPTPVTPEVVPPDETTGPTVPDVDEEPTEENVTTVYLGIRCDETGSLESILDTLDVQNKKAAFFFSPEALERQDDLLYRILAQGHTVGLLAEGATLAQTQQMLQEGNQILRKLTYTTTQVALVPRAQRAQLDELGWICWRETVNGVPDETDSGSSYTDTIVRKLGKTRYSAYLTLDAGENTARMLTALLTTLRSEGYAVNVPLEVRL